MNIYSKTIIVSAIGGIVSLLSSKLLDKFFPEKKEENEKLEPPLDMKKI